MEVNKYENYKKSGISAPHLIIDWEFGAVIEGKVTNEFKKFIASLPKPIDAEIYDKKTPFFSIFFDNGFSSEHYGTEINYCRME